MKSVWLSGLPTDGEIGLKRTHLVRSRTTVLNHPRTSPEKKEQERELIRGRDLLASSNLINVSDVVRLATGISALMESKYRCSAVSRLRHRGGLNGRHILGV